MFPILPIEIENKIWKCYFTSNILPNILYRSYKINIGFNPYYSKIYNEYDHDDILLDRVMYIRNYHNKYLEVAILHKTKIIKDENYYTDNNGILGIVSNNNITWYDKYGEIDPYQPFIDEGSPYRTIYELNDIIIG